MLSKQNILDVVIFCLGLFTGLYFFTFQVIGFDFSHFPGDLGDGRLNLYFLEHAHKFFTGQLSASFWDAPFMYPEKNVIAYSDNLLGSAPIYSFFRLIGIERFTAYQWWFVVVSTLNFATAFIFLKKLFKNSYAAVIGAMVFAFSMALQSQMTHAQTFPRFAIPLAFLALYSFQKEFNPKYFFFSILAIVYQFYCAIYLGFMLMVPVGIYLIILILQNKSVLFLKLKEGNYWLKIILSLLVNVVLLAPLMLPYMERSRGASINFYYSIASHIPLIKSYFFSHSGSFLWDYISNIGTDIKAYWNHQIFPGGIALLSAAFVIYLILRMIFFRKQNILKHDLFPFLLTAIITFTLYLRFSDYISAYLALFFLPAL